MTEIRAGVCHFHSHSVDQSSVMSSLTIRQPIVSPGSRGKNMNVAGAVEAVSATQESLNPLSSFLAILNQTNTTHQKALFHWLSGSDWRPCCIINLALVPLPNVVNASQSTSFCFISFHVVRNPALPLYFDQAPGSPPRAVQGLAPEECIRHQHTYSITFSLWLEHDVICLCRIRMTPSSIPLPPKATTIQLSFSQLQESDLLSGTHSSFM